MAAHGDALRRLRLFGTLPGEPGGSFQRLFIQYRFTADQHAARHLGSKEVHRGYGAVDGCGWDGRN